MDKFIVALLSICGITHAYAADIEWPAYGGAPGGGHYSQASQITKDNVANLTRAWTHRSGDYVEGSQQLGEELTEESTRSRPTNFIVTPIMVRGTLYYCTSYNRVFALDPATGKERWVFDPEIDMSQEGLTNCRAVSSWIDPEAPDAPCGHRIILGTLDARIIALDGATGKRCPAFGRNGEVSLAAGLSKHSGFEYSITSAPAIIGDLIISGAFVADSQRPDVPAGVVRAYNVRTGAFVWGWNPTHPDQPQADEIGTYTPGTTNVWSTISVDAERGLVIVPTGNSSPDY